MLTFYETLNMLNNNSKKKEWYLQIIATAVSKFVKKVLEILTKW